LRGYNPNSKKIIFRKKFLAFFNRGFKDFFAKFRCLWEKWQAMEFFLNYPFFSGIFRQVSLRENRGQKYPAKKGGVCKSLTPTFPPPPPPIVPPLVFKAIAKTSKKVL
jgi:hypothetical protein